MALNIGKEIAALKRMTVPELRRKYAHVFGEDTTSRHKEYFDPSPRLAKAGQPGGRPVRTSTETSQGTGRRC